MTAVSAKTRLVALLSAAMLGAAACGTITNAETVEPGDPRSGGTLRLVGSGDVDRLDTASAYYVPTWMLLHAMTRQLMSYPYTSDPEDAVIPVPDLAEAAPTISDDGLTYTFTIRDGATWDIPDVEGGRQIVGEDVVLGFKRLCNPVAASGALGYFTATIVGMADYCSAWKADVDTRTAEAEDFEITPDYIREWIEQNDIDGIQATDRTVQFTLLAPASDFLNILAMSFASPVPEEALDYLPDSQEYRQAFISSGPYRKERYIVNQSIYLERNPSWNPDSDPLRHAYVDRIEIIEGSDQGPVQRQIEAGTADLAWDVPVPGADVVRHLELGSPQLSSWPSAAITYLVFNLYEEGSPLQDVRVRQAINYAIDKENVARIQGGPPVVEPTGQILTPVVVASGFEEQSQYAVANRQEGLTRAQALLEEAGFEPGEIELTFLYRATDLHSNIAQSIEADLSEAGINVHFQESTPSGFYVDYLFDADGAKEGKWDIAVPGWAPDWYGNAGRSFLVPLLDGRYCGNDSTNFGCYNNAEVNSLIDQALAASSAEEAGVLWMQADQRAMQDAPWVPLTTQNTARFHSERVGGYVVSPGLNVPDLTNLWLNTE